MTNKSRRLSASAPLVEAVLPGPNTSESKVQEEELLGYPEAARFLGLRLGTLYSMVHFHKVPHVRYGRRFVKFRRSDLAGWIAERVVPAADAGGGR